MAGVGFAAATCHTMYFFSPGEKRHLHILIVGSGAVVFIAYSIAFPGLQYFWDPSVKWFQVIDLLERGYREISCTYPAVRFDPDFRFIPIPYTTAVDGRCFYWFPFQLSFAIAPLYTMFGVWSIPVFQQGMSLIVLYGLVALAGRLGFSFAKTAAAVVLFRFGTANLAAVHNLEDHTITQSLVMGAFLIGLRGTRSGFVLSGAISGLSFGFRQETILLAPFVFGSLWWNRSRTGPGAKEGAAGIWISFWFACAAGLGSQLFLNYALVGHPLGMRAIHGPHMDFWNIPVHAKRALGHLFFEWPWLPNGMLFQMPLLALVPLNFRPRFRSSTTVGILIVVCALPALLWISPGGGPHIGYRFAQPLVPFLILLALQPIDWARIRWPIRAVLSTGFAVSILIAVGVGVLGMRVYRGYVDAQKELRRLPGDVIILRDNETWAALGALYYERPVMQIVRDEDLPAALQRIRESGKQSVIFVHSTMVKSRRIVPHALQVSEEGRGRLLEWAVIRFPDAR